MIASRASPGGRVKEPREIRIIGGMTGEPSRRQVASARIAVCVATCRRPELLRELLASLDGQTFSRVRAAEFDVIVVDNDPEGGALATIEQARGSCRRTITYRHEPRQGIPQARNAGLDAAKEYELISFIDDDERADGSWLDALLDARVRYGADVVAGPVVPVFAEDVPEWARRSGFFSRPRHETGGARPWASTNNVLFDGALARRLSIRFDERFAGTMGEDQDFFHRMKSAGARIVWADDAVVREYIPGRRASPGRLIARMYHIGRSTSTIEGKSAKGRPAVAAKIILRSAAWLVIGFGSMPTGLLARRWMIRSCRWIAYGAGLFHGLIQPRR